MDSKIDDNDIKLLLKYALARLNSIAYNEKLTDNEQRIAEKAFKILDENLIRAEFKNI